MESKLGKLSIVLGFLFALIAVPAFAQTVPVPDAEETFVISATIPSATGVSITAFEIDAESGEFAAAGTDFDFGTLTLDPEAEIFLPDHFYAVDVAGTGGPGNPDITVTYEEGANPNDPDHGLGWKAAATFMHITGSGTDTEEEPIASMGPKQLLKDLSGDIIDATEMAGGWLRMYVGIVTLDPDAVIPDPAGAEPFSNADQPGVYDGTLLISATL